LLSFFDPEYIASDILTDNAREIDESNPLRQILKYTLNFDKSISQLRQLSLQRFTHRADEPKALWIHDLVHELYRKRMTNTVQKESLELALTLLHACFPEEKLDMYETSNWRDYEKCLPHIVAGIKHADKLESHSVKFASLCRDAGWFFYFKGGYDKAVDLAGISIPLLELHYDKDDERYLSAINLLAAANHTRGNFQQALKWYFEILASRKRKYGMSRKTADTMHNIALCYHEAGEYKESQKLFEEAVAFLNSECGADDVNTIISVLSMSRNIRYMGNFELAEEDLWKCRKVFLEENGPKNMFFLIASTELASAIWRRNSDRFAEAENIHQNSLAVKIEVLGEEHVHTLDSYADIGCMILKCDHSRLDEGEEYILKAIKSYVETMGISHVQTIEYYDFLVDFYQTTNRYEKIEALKERFGSPIYPKPPIHPVMPPVFSPIPAEQHEVDATEAPEINATRLLLENQLIVEPAPAIDRHDNDRKKHELIHVGMFPSISSLPELSIISNAERKIEEPEVT
jgi:tetratricopeptide (TPR) repeat protein